MYETKVIHEIRARSQTEIKAEIESPAPRTPITHRDGLCFACPTKVIEIQSTSIHIILLKKKK
jgi:hypothetical protein